jgi:preprotein translocase subunit YajC
MNAAISTLLYVVIFVVMLFFFAVRPQRKRQQEAIALLGRVKPGDEIVTVSGIYGTVTEIEDDKTMLLEIAENTEIRVARGAISSIVTPPADPAPAGEVQ